MSESEFDYTVKAVLRNGELNVSVTVAVPIIPGSNRTATKTLDQSALSDAVVARLEKALVAAWEQAQEQAVLQGRVAAAQSLAVAARLGEV